MLQIGVQCSDQGQNGAECVRISGGGHVQCPACVLAARRQRAERPAPRRSASPKCIVQVGGAVLPRCPGAWLETAAGAAVCGRRPQMLGSEARRGCRRPSDLARGAYLRPRIFVKCPWLYIYIVSDLDCDYPNICIYSVLIWILGRISDLG